jgi:DNA-binding transcriptional ArsR family regulator
MPAAHEPPAPYRADFAPVAALMADSTRAVMLDALLAGRPLAAGELGRIAGVSPATASAHLAKLLDGGIVTVTVQGRHRYYRLAGHEIAAVIEAMSRISPPAPARNLRQSREAAALDEARTCYDHLAGRAGVALLDAMLAGRLLQAHQAENPPGSRTRAGESAPATFYEITGQGTETMSSFGINVDDLRRSRRHFAGSCLDWTQRRRHLNGALGAAVTARLFELGWIQRAQRRRSIRVTGAGRDGLAETFGWTDGPVSTGRGGALAPSAGGRALRGARGRASGRARRLWRRGGRACGGEVAGCGDARSDRRWQRPHH